MLYMHASVRHQIAGLARGGISAAAVTVVCFGLTKTTTAWRHNGQNSSRLS